MRFIDGPAKFSVGTLRDIRKLMTPGEYSIRDGVVESATAGVNQYLPKPVCEVFTGNGSNNAFGIAATHNAADAMLDVVEACCAVYEARKCRERFSAATHEFEPLVVLHDGQLLEARRLDVLIAEAEDRLVAALARFRS